ncbi:MAG: hypothetical protein ACK5WZ_07355 [Pseudobdellovibrionaceae bacterium]
MMKALNQLEVQMISERLHDDLIGAQLQDVWAFKEGLVLHFYLRQDLFLLIDIKKSTPYVGVFPGASPVPRQTKKKPVGLFLASHAKNLYLKSVENKIEFGRVFEMHLSTKKASHTSHLSDSVSQSVVVIQVLLIPHRANIVVQLYQGQQKSGASQRMQTQSYAVTDYAHDLKLVNEIFWNKPVPLEERESVLPEGLETRSFAELNRQWSESFRPTKETKVAKMTEAVFHQQRQKNLIKKTDAMDVIASDLKRMIVPYSEWGKLLTRFQYETQPTPKPYQASEFVQQIQNYFKKNELELPEEGAFCDWVRKNIKLHDLQNLVESAFEENKQQTRKIAGLQERLQLLSEEIEILQNQTYQSFLQSPGAKKKPQRELEEVKARKMNLISGAIVYLGKSAADNLKILRTAKAWDYWLHLRDLPGAHAIIHRDRNQNLSDEEIRKVAQWVIKESVKSKMKLDGQKFDVMMTECRFVKPIKGDRLGRVNFSNEKNFVYYFRSES